MNVRTLAALLVLAAAGCTVDNNASVRIANTCMPPEPSTGGCSYSSTCDTVWMGNLWVDTSYASPQPDPSDGTLEWPFEFENQRAFNLDREGGTDTATAFVTGYKIHYVLLSGPAGTNIPDVRIEDSSRTVKPGGSTVILIPVIPRSVTTLFRGVVGLKVTFRAEIRATGAYADGQAFETGPYSVVVDIVNGRGVYYGCPAAGMVIFACPQLGQTAVTTCE